MLHSCALVYWGDAVLRDNDQLMLSRAAPFSGGPVSKRTRVRSKVQLPKQNFNEQILPQQSIVWHSAKPQTNMAKRTRSDSEDDGSVIRQAASKSRRSWEQDDGPSKLSNHATQILKNWMLSEEHFDYPYPTPEVSRGEVIGGEVGISQINFTKTF